MKKSFSFAFIVFLALAGSVSAQDAPTITIVNKTGYTVRYIYVRQTASDSWGGNVLGTPVLNTGYEVLVILPYPLDVATHYDIKLVDSDGDSYTKVDVLVTQNSGIVFIIDDID